MEEGAGVRVRSCTIGITDAIIILFVIALLGGTLTRLVVLKIPRLAAHAEEQMRAVKSQLSFNLIGPQQAVAGAPPLTFEEVLPPFGIEFERFVTPPMMLGAYERGKPASTTTTAVEKERRVRRHAKRSAARQSSTSSPTQK